MKTWKDDFSKRSLAEWHPEIGTVPDTMAYTPHYPENCADWKAGGGILEATSKADAWCYLLRGDESDADFTLEFDMMIPSLTLDRTECFFHYINGYRSGEFEPCWDTCAVIRYVDRENFYRVQIFTGGSDPSTSGGGVIALWSPKGGFMQVVSCEPKPLTWRKVKIVAAGAVIEVWVDGELKIHYHDTVSPNLKGRCGLGVHGNQFFRFANVSLRTNRNTLPAEDAIQPGKGKMRFYLRQFLRQRYLFCNNEPIGRLSREGSTIYDVRLRPGYRTSIWFHLRWDQSDGSTFVEVPEKWDIEKTDGPRFMVTYRYRHPDGNVTVSGRLTVSYDRKLGSYSWDVDSTLAVVKGRTLLNEHHGLSFANPLPYDIAPNAIDIKDPWPLMYDSIVFQAPDGEYYRHPLIHDHIPTNEYRMMIKSEGGLAMAMNNPLSNPGIEFNFKDDGKINLGFWLCPWAYDIHYLINPYKVGYKIPGGTRHRVKFRYISIHGKRADEIYQRSTVHPYFKTLPRRILFTAGVNSFDKTTMCDVPHREYFWKGGQWDRKVGRSDNYSMRLTNKNPKRPELCYAYMGGSQFMGRFDSRKYTITGWIKTENVKGRGVRLFAENGPIRVYGEKALKGTGTWRKLTLETEILYQVLMGNVGIELDGTGTVWLDDFQLTPLGIH